jgi:hypothetical protein
MRSCNCIAGVTRPVISLGRNFVKFQPEKYDFHLYKSIFMEKMAQICQILNFFKSPVYYDKL